MWKFLQGVHRVIRQHVHSPRPSANLYVEEEQDKVDKVEKVCPFSSWKRRNSQEDVKPKCSTNALESLHLVGPEDDLTSGDLCCSSSQSRRKKWWRSCQNEFWQYIRQSHQAFEALSWGSVVIWGTDSDRLRARTRLIYKVLSSVPGRSVGQNNVVNAMMAGSGASKAPPLLAIKDAAGSAHDTAVNITKSETLDSAMEEFQSMCHQYTARNEIMLGHQAWEKGDMTSAIHHLQASCLLGNSRACFNLGSCYEHGSGVEPDLDKAERYYKLAAKGGNSMAMFNLGLLYMNHLQAGDASSSAHGDYKKKEAISLMERAAKLGLAEAQTYLGMYHIDEMKDLGRAVQYFRAAAEQNDPEAQYFLASCYEHGWGVEMNECRAAQLYSQAAGAGHVTAMYNLAEFNENGLGGLPEDHGCALELYQKAADLGSDEARHRLQEIETEKKQCQESAEKVKVFEQLFISHHGNTGLHHSSASSPNLLDYLYSIPDVFIGQLRGNTKREEGLDGLSLAFHADMPTVSTVNTSVAEFGSSGELFAPIPKEIHRSQTYPNMVVCNM